jgi:hypothetical protein
MCWSAHATVGRQPGFAGVRPVQLAADLRDPLFRRLKARRTIAREERHEKSNSTIFVWRGSGANLSRKGAKAAKKDRKEESAVRWVFFGFFLCVLGGLA